MTTATANKKTKKNQKGTVATGVYNNWVRKVRATEIEARRIVLKRYHLLLEGQKKQVWKQGPYRNFNECILREFGISAVTWTGLQQTISRFGEDAVESLGYEACVTMLRLPKRSPAERHVLREISDMAHKNGGRAPSTLSIGRLVAKYAPALKPVDAVPTILERLRAELRDTKEKLRVVTAELRQTKAELRAVTKPSKPRK